MKHHFAAFFAIFLFCLLPFYAQAQSTYLPLEHLNYRTLERIEIKSGKLTNELHTSVRPFLRESAVRFAEQADDMTEAGFSRLDRNNQYFVYKNNNEFTDWGLINSKKPFLKHFYKYKSDLIDVRDSSNFLLKVNPVLRFELGKEKDNEGLQFANVRGVTIRGNIGDKVGFYSFLSESQHSFPDYVRQQAIEEVALPNEGRFKAYESSIADGFLAPAFDYWTANGYVSFQPIKQINVQVGHDKNFIGNGIRSLLLSDFSNNYFFLKMNTKVGRFNYQNLFMQLVQQFDSFGDGYLPKKYATMHHLSFNATSWLNIGVFESVVFGREDGFDVSYVNPLIFYRAVEFHLGSADNVLIGFDYKANFAKHFSLYGQVVIDEFSFSEIKNRTGWWANKQGYQVGLKYIDVANVSNLDAQIEWNVVRPYTYAHQTAATNYTHFNQALAHPLGANFRELIGTVSYQINKNIFAELNVMYAQKGKDWLYFSDGSVLSEGGNIFNFTDNIPNIYDNKLLQGEKVTIFLADVRFSYMLRHNLFFDIGYMYRNQTSETSSLALFDQQTHFANVGFRLNSFRKKFWF